MNILVTYIEDGATYTREVPETSSIESYINEVATAAVEFHATEDCALDKPDSEYIITHDAPTKSRVFRDGELFFSISAQ